jgi:hypothetical protein
MKTSALWLAVLCLLGTPDRAESVAIGYQTLPQLVERGEISDVEIYESGACDIDAVLIKADGTRLTVKKPYQLSEDSVFLEYLRSHRIPYTVYDRECTDSQSGKCSSFGGLGCMVLFSTLSFLGVPVLSIIAITVLSLTVAKQAKIIRSLSGVKN